MNLKKVRSTIASLKRRSAVAPSAESKMIDTLIHNLEDELPDESQPLFVIPESDREKPKQMKVKPKDPLKQSTYFNIPD